METADMEEERWEAENKEAAKRIYSPLKDKEFRLLKIKARSHCPSDALLHQKDIPVCELAHAIRGMGNSYDTLSYTWGHQRKPCPIQLNGEKYQVTRNLGTVLEYIRKIDDDVEIWIDAVCINQCDFSEKNTQVPQMKDIYSQSSCTLVWLGPPAEGSDGMISECNRIGTQLVQKNIPRTSGNELGEESILDLMTEMGTSPSNDSDHYQAISSKVQDHLRWFFDEAKKDLPGTLTHLVATQKLLERAYWDRVWIRQEFIVSPKIQIQCGLETTPALHFDAWLLYITLLKVSIVNSLMPTLIDMRSSATVEIRHKMNDWLDKGCPEEIDPAITDFKYLKDLFFAFANCDFGKSTVNLTGMRRSYQNVDKNTSLTLIRILARVHLEGTTQSFDKRDRIFAMIQMASDGAELARAIPVDYSENNVYGISYTKAARAIIARGDVDLLSLAQRFQESPEPTANTWQIPAWVPDWSLPMVRPCGQLPWDSFFAASGDSIFDGQAFATANDMTKISPTQVKLQGWRVDEIESLGSEWHPQEQTYRNEYDKMHKYLSDIARLCAQSNTKIQTSGENIYVNLADQVDAHKRIPIADQERYGVGFIRKAAQDNIQRYMQLVICIENKLSHPESDHYVSMIGWQRFRKPFLSSKGYVGLVPAHAKKGDILVIFLGAKFPYVLRNIGEDSYTFIGEAYIHGIMYGEFLMAERVIQEFLLG